MYHGKKIDIDLQYGDKIKDCTSLNCSFYDLDCVYRGNIMKNGRFVGDFVTDDFREVEKLRSRMNGGKV